MAKKSALLATEIEIDPMASRVQRRNQKNHRLKIERTGMTHSNCINCGGLPIDKFIVRKGKPRGECNECLNARRKREGAYDRDLANKRGRYKTDKKFRKSLRKNAKRARKILSDSYIKKLLRAAGYTDDRINPKMIKTKRAEVKAIRKNAADKAWVEKKKSGAYTKKASEELSPGYVRNVIKRSAFYDGTLITDEMILEKKLYLLEAREKGTKPWFKPPMSAEETKRKTKERSDRYITTLNDVYIRSRIKCSKDYKGEEITQKMIEIHRAKILKIRNNKQDKVRALRPAAQLTDAYVRKIVATVLKIPKEEVTWMQIIKKREELELKRQRLGSRNPKEKETHKKEICAETQH